MIKKFKVLRLVGLTLVVAATWMACNSSVQAAPLFPEPNNWGGGIQPLRRQYLENCNTGGPAVTTWMSPINQGSAVTYTVPYGTPYIDLQFNDAGVVCEASNRGFRYANRVKSVSADVTDLVGKVTGYTFSAHTSPGNYAYGNNTFRYTPVGGFTTTRVHRPTAIAESIIENTDGTFKCVVGGAPVLSLSDFEPCPEENAFLELEIIVGPPPDRPVGGGIDRGACDAGNFRYSHRNNNTYNVQASIMGAVQDPDYDFTQVHVYIDNVNPANLGELVYVGAYDASQYPVSIDGADPWTARGKPAYGTGVPNWHDWFVVPKADTDRFADAYNHTVYVFGIGKNRDGSNNADNREIFKPDGSRVTLNNCAPPACTVTTIPAPPEPGQQFAIRFSYTYSPGAQGRPIGPTGTVSFNGGPSQSWAFLPPSRTGASRDFTGFSQNNAGTYTIAGSLTNAGSQPVPNCNNTSVQIAGRPYVKVYGNDVSVGGKFADDTATRCDGTPPSSPTASIWTYDKRVIVGANTYYGGASSQFGVAALGVIDSFASAGARNLANAQPLPANGLSFGNMLNNTKVTVNNGGDSGMSRCIPDYYSASANAGAIVRPNGHTLNAADLPTAAEPQKAVFVNGDLYINNNVILATAATNWTNVNQIPNFYVVVKGNIYIDRNVTQLDGTYVAQKTDADTKGTIYTCTNGRNLFRSQDLYNGCQLQLRMTGSFIANQVKYQRAKGSVAGSIPSGPAAATQRGFTWSSAGRVAGQACVQFDEPSDYANTWNDNFLCSQTDYGLRFSFSLPIPGMTCINLPKPPPYPVAATWSDNYLCWPPAQNLQLTWSTNGQENAATRYCTNIAEIGPWGTQTFICEPRVAQPQFNPTSAQLNEGPGSTNIAEIFNFSQEMYLAPIPPILQSVVGGSSTGTTPRYEAITSLPPIL